MFPHHFNHQFHYNPFGGLSDEELFEVMVPKEFIKDILEDLNSPKQMVIELLGKHGRGKTSHLKLLRNLFGKGDLFELSKGKEYRKEWLNRGDILFIDSIHHLPIFDRIKAYKSAHKLVLTTHQHRGLEYILAGRPFRSYRFRGIEKSQLIQVIEERMRLAVKDGESVEIDEKLIDNLLEQHKDDFRAILKTLYDNISIDEG